MTATPRLNIPLIASGQAQKDVTHNEAILAIDQLIALAAVSRSVVAPPTNPTFGAVYLVPVNGVSAWGAAAGTMMYWQGNGWSAVQPRTGQLALIVDEGIMISFRQTWQSLWPVAGLEIGGRAVLTASPTTITSPVGGATVDSEARLAITSIISLLVQQGLASA